MKKLHLLPSLLLCLTVSAGALSAQDAAVEQEHAALRALRDKVQLALNQQDIETLASCMAKNFTFVAVDQTVIVSEAQLRDFFTQSFHGKNALVTGYHTELQADALTAFIGDNVGICHGISKEVYQMKSGREARMNVRWTATLVRENGEWKAASVHSGISFLDNPVLDLVKNRIWKIGAGVLLAGLALGLVISCGRCCCRALFCRNKK